MPIIFSRSFRLTYEMKKKWIDPDAAIPNIWHKSASCIQINHSLKPKSNSLNGGVFPGFFAPAYRMGQRGGQQLGGQN